VDQRARPHRADVFSDHQVQNLCSSIHLRGRFPPDGGSNADYIGKSSFTILVPLPRITRICWFNEAKQPDWQRAESCCHLNAAVIVELILRRLMQ
jgi:hypothetical protein